MSSLLIFIDMKQQKVQALTSAEVSEILALQKWATYSQEYPIRYACTLNGALVQVDSFGIDNLPKLMLWWCSAVIRGLSSMPGKHL